MKLLVQSDDYGITKAAALGIIEGIKNGIVRNTGMFMNMPWTDECAKWIRPYLDQIALGIDLNVSTGPAILSKEDIPSLVQDNGYYLTSSMNRALDTDENDHDHVVYEDVYKEFEAQILKFIELFGRKPDYLHGHAYGTKTTRKAQDDLSKKYGIIYSMDIEKLYGAKGLGMNWYTFPPTLDNQYASSLEEFILNTSEELLNSNLCYLICHAGYVDRDLMELSSFNIYRLNDLHGVTSDKVKQWVKDHHIELVTYKDLK